MSERLSWSEAEAVVRAYRAERGMASDVDVAALAQMLGTSSADVQRLARRSRRFVDRSGVLSAALAFGVVTAASLAVYRSTSADDLIITKVQADGRERIYKLDSGTGVPSNDLRLDPTHTPSSDLIPNEPNM